MAERHDLLLQQAIAERRHGTWLAEASKAPSQEEQINAWIGGELPPIHIYRVPFEASRSEGISESDFPPEVWGELQAIVSVLKRQYQTALETGSIDHRQPLEPARAAWFKKQVDAFDPNKYPNNVPEVLPMHVATFMVTFAPFFSPQRPQLKQQLSGDGGAIFHLR
jgi:hypothetical protein